MTHAILRLTPEQATARRAALEALLVDSVEGGASVNFVWPMTAEKAARWWDGALDSHARGERVLFTAEQDGRVDGTVQLIFAPQENQVFRADISKMLVHRRARRQGLGERLMRAAEDEARARGKLLLTLDTEAGSDGERLYARLGWQKFGTVPGFALNAEGVARKDCSFFYREL